MKGEFARSWIPMVGLASLLVVWIFLPSVVSSRQQDGGADPLSSNIQALDSAAVAPDAYEPDNTWQTSKVIILNDQNPHPDVPSYKPIQDHNFHVAGDEDWVKFFILKDEIYKITVDSPGESCDVVITIYDTDGETVIKEVDDTFSREKEYAEWECKADGIYYARIRQYNPDIFGEGTDYRLSLTQPYMTFDARIFGTVTPPVEAKIRTNGNGSAIICNGEYYMPHRAGDFILEAFYDGCTPFSMPLTVLEIRDMTVDFALNCGVQKGTLKVVITPRKAINEGAKWRVDTGAWQVSDATVSDLSVGKHSLDFKSRAGWEAPDARTVDISVGATTSVSAEYEWVGDLCLDADGAKDVTVSCAQYGDAKFFFMLNFYTKAQNPTAMYWKMDWATFSAVNSSACIPVSGDLSMTMDCVEYNGTKYECVLRYYEDPDDIDGHHWEMDLSTLKVKDP